MTLGDIVSRGYRDVTAFLKKQKRAAVFLSALTAAAAGFQCTPRVRGDSGENQSGSGRAEECYADRDCVGDSVCEENQCVQPVEPGSGAVISSAQTNGAGEAHFIDREDDEEVIIQVKDDETGAALSGKNVFFFDGIDYEAFLVTDPHEEHIQSLNVFTHNSLHVIPMCKKERGYCLNQIIENDEHLRSFISFTEGAYQKEFHYKTTISREDRVIANRVGFWIFNLAAGKALGAIMSGLHAAPQLERTAEQIREEVTHKFQDRITGVLPDHPAWDLYAKSGRQSVVQKTARAVGGMNIYVPSNIPQVQDISVTTRNDKVQLSWNVSDAHTYGPPNAITPPEDLTIYEGQTRFFDHEFRYTLFLEGNSVPREERRVGILPFTEISNLQPREYRVHLFVNDEVGNESFAETRFRLIGCEGGIGTEYKECGKNERGFQRRECRNGSWEPVGNCNDPDACLDGTREERACAGGNMQQKECMNGTWTTYTTCRPERCEEGNSDVEQCGLNNRGTREVYCENGQIRYGSCDDSDACRNGSIVDTGQQCGINNRGQMYRECVNGNWSAPACRENNECVHRAEQQEACGNGELDNRYRRCENGAWSAWTECGGCLPGMGREIRCGSDVGECVSGMELIVCDERIMAWNRDVCQGEVAPRAEVCRNGRDEDCDGVSDNGCPVVQCRDADGDGYGVGDGCRGPDCDDRNINIHPGIDEVCRNGVDDNCDGRVDERCPAQDVPVQDLGRGRLSSVAIEWMAESELDLHVYTPDGCHAYPEGNRDCQPYLSINTIHSRGAPGACSGAHFIRFEEALIIPGIAPLGEYLINVRAVQQNCVEFDRNENRVPYALIVRLETDDEISQFCTPEEAAAEQPSASACQRTYRFIHER